MAEAALAINSITDFLGSASLIQVLRERLQAQPAGGAAVLVIGPSGCGKTTLCNLLLKEANAEVCRLTTDDIAADGAKGLLRRLELFRDTRSVQSFFWARQRVFLLDDVDAMHTMDRLVQGTILGFVRDDVFAKSDIILLMTASDERKLTDIKRRAEVLRMAHPSAAETASYLETRVPGVDIDKLQQTCQQMGGAVRASALQYIADLDATGSGTCEDDERREALASC